MESRQAKLLKEELQTMKNALIVEMKKMLKEVLVVEVNEEFTVELKM